MQSVILPAHATISNASTISPGDTCTILPGDNGLAYDTSGNLQFYWYPNTNPPFPYPSKDIPIPLSVTIKGNGGATVTGNTTGTAYLVDGYITSNLEFTSLSPVTTTFINNVPGSIVFTFTAADSRCWIIEYGANHLGNIPHPGEVPY